MLNWVSTELGEGHLWKNQRPAYMHAGQWGLFKVLPAGDRQILPLMPQAADTRTTGHPSDRPVVRTSGVDGGQR